ncbi:MAG: hypothetical protein ACE14V_11160 [bacterium]
MHRLLILLVILVLAATCTSAMTISSEAPGNIFITGKSIQFRITDTEGKIEYTIKDYFHSTITANKLESQAPSTILQLGTFQPGWYELLCQDKNTTQSVSFGVVIDRNNAPLSKEGKICADAASAWLIRDDKLREPFARMVKLAGVPWVRERIAWHAVEEQPGKFDWKQYQTVADTLSVEGIHISQIWHDSPAWANDTKTNLALIADLRDVYRFSKTASAHFANQIQAWEVWNEPDVSFWQGLADRFAGVQKAAYLGIKDGNPNAVVLNGALCIGVHPFAHNLFESGIAPYMDIFNWHDYAPPSTFPMQLREYRRNIAYADLADKPAWLTEAGLPLRQLKKTGIILDEGQRNQCRWVPQSLIMSLAAGVDKSFYFVLPHYLENGNQFGLLHPDLSPYPGFLALSACANILGESEYRGSYNLNIPDVTAQVFQTKHTQILTIWSNTNREITIPVNRKTHDIKLLNIFGQETIVESNQGKLNIKVGPETIYLVGKKNWLKSKLILPATLPHPAIGKSKTPSRIVVEGYCYLPFEKDYGSYNVAKGKPFPYFIELYNFNQHQTVKGTLSISAPSEWNITIPKQEFFLKPMDRQIVELQITPFGIPTGAFKVTVLFKPEKQQQPFPISVSYFKFDLAELAPVARKPLNWGDAAKWQSNVSDNGMVKIEPSFPDTIRITSQFTTSGDRWAYPVLNFDPPVDLSGYDGIMFEMEGDHEVANILTGLMLVEPNGAQYLKQTPLLFGKQKLVFLFKDMHWGSFSTVDDNLHLDLNRISAVKLGLNTNRNEAHFEAGKFELVKF